jgi:selenide,water dikinase
VEAERLLNRIRTAGYPSARIVGKVTDDAGRVTVTG